VKGHYNIGKRPKLARMQQPADLQRLAPVCSTMNKVFAMLVRFMIISYACFSSSCARLRQLQAIEERD
jgi:hypothetical protein